MDSNRNTEIDGSLSVGRKITAGGDLTVRGKATFGHDVKVEGWLEAPNIKDINKGIYLSYNDLLVHYPTPHDGWLAGVVEAVSGGKQMTAYLAVEGQWVKQDYALEVDMDVEELVRLGAHLFVNVTKLMGLDEATTLSDVLTMISGMSETVAALYMVPGVVLTFLGEERWETWRWTGETAEDWEDETTWEDIEGGGSFATGEKVKNVGIDDEPTAGSDNLVKSGGVYNTPKIMNSSVDSDLDISDENGNVLARFKNGHLQTKNFDSRKSGIYSESELYGKRIINFGDSIAFGENSYKVYGDVSTKGYSYAPMLADVINGTCINNAVSGYTIQQILTKVNSCLSQVGDIIFIEGGTNNMNNTGTTPNLTPGSVDISIYTEPSDSPSTFAEYVERIMWVVKNTWKEAFVYWVIPHRMQTRNITQQNTYWRIVKQAATKWGVRVIDIYNESCFTAAPLELGAMYTDYNDPLGVTHGGTHPNTEGYKKYYLPIIYDIVLCTARKLLS